MHTSSVSSEKKMLRGKYPIWNRLLWEQGEEWTKHILWKIKQSGVEFKVVNNCDYFWNANIDHVLEFKNGNFLVLESKNWNTRMKPYLKRELWKLDNQIDFVKRLEHTNHVYGGLVCYRKNIHNGIRKSWWHKYLIRPQSLKRMILKLSA